MYPMREIIFHYRQQISELYKQKQKFSPPESFIFFLLLKTITKQDDVATPQYSPYYRNQWKGNELTENK